VITHGETGNSFFIILKGIVSVLIPNPKIKNWRIRRIQYKLDMEWLDKFEEKYFTKKAELSLQVKDDHSSSPSKPSQNGQ